MILSQEYMLAIVISVIILFAVGAILMNTAEQQAKAPKVSIKMVKMLVVRKTTGLYFELILQSQSTSTVCINYIDLVDLSTGNKITIGDHDVGEASNLPVCIKPSETFTLGAYQGLESGFMPGTKVAVILHYSIGSPDTTYNENNPYRMYFFTKVIGT